MSDKVVVSQHKIEVNPADVEQAAALGMNQEQIADGLGIAERTWRDKRQHSSELRAAYKRGRYLWQQAVLEKLKTRDYGRGQAVIDIFTAKHAMGWYDSNTLKVEGSIEHRVTPAQEAFKRGRLAGSEDALEVEYTDVTDED